MGLKVGPGHLLLGGRFPPGLTRKSVNRFDEKKYMLCDGELFHPCRLRIWHPDLRAKSTNGKLAVGFAFRDPGVRLFVLSSAITELYFPTLERSFSERPCTEDKLEPGISEPITDSTINRARDGDTTAITDLYNYYKPAIYRYLFHRSSVSQVAEELTTEVFIRVIENLPRYKVKDVPFQAWLFRIARNLLIDHFRRLKTRQYAEFHENIVSTADGPETVVEHNLDVEQLHKALKQLTPDQSDVIVLRFLAEMPINEVAHVLKKSEGAVKMLQARALESLYHLIKK